MCVVENQGNAIKKKKVEKKPQASFLKGRTIDTFNRIMSYKEIDP